MPELPHTPVIFMPQIRIADHIESALPLEQTTVSAQVTGLAASVLVRQRFGNPLTEPAELEYLFPLPEDAAITGFVLQVGERRIVGDLQEREAAKEAYEAARDEGKRAGMLEQRRPNLFAVRLANVLPGETLHAEVRYQQQLKFEDGGYEFIYPMGLTPKFDSPQHPGEGEGTHAPIAHGEKIGPVAINVVVDAGAAVGDAASPSHPLETSRLDERRFQVKLSGEHIPDRDFVLRYALTGVQPQGAGWVAQQENASYFMATLVPPRMEDEGASDSVPLPREFVFVLDRSGSMSGEPIAQARNALRASLRAIGPQDTFRILLFDNELDWFQQEPSTMTQEQVDRADAYLDRVQGRGGTEIVRALEAALSLPADPARMRFIVFLTDGAVSAEARAVEQIRRQIGGARLFTFGIGSSVNRALLNRMAAIGRGRSEFLQLNEDIEGAIIRFQDSVSFPLITDLSLDWHGVKAYDLYPARLPDLYYGQPLEIVGRIAAGKGKKGMPELTLRGKRAGKPVEVRLGLAESAGDDPTVARAWARARVDDLLDQMEMEPGRSDKIRAEIIGLAMEYNLVTTYTAFVGVDSTPVTAGGQPKVIQVAQPLPHGVVPEVYGGGQPRMMANMMMPASAPLPAMPKVMKSLVQRASAAARGDAPVHRQTGFDRGMVESAQEKTALPMGEAGLRELARTQNVDGSWSGDVERTAAALIALVRAGHTTRAGSYRQVVRRAARWLADARGQEFSEFARARALHELAAATKDAALQATAQEARDALPIPGGHLEAFAAGQGPETWPTPKDPGEQARLEAMLPGAGSDAALTWVRALG